MKKVLCIALALFSCGRTIAGEPTCNVYNGSPYCSYSGKVQKIYVNDGDMILMFFDTPLNLDQPASVGISGVANVSAAAIKISTNPEFAKLFYSTALSAQATGRSVVVQMRNTLGGYLVLDRIWLAAP